MLEQISKNFTCACEQLHANFGGKPEKDLELSLALKKAGLIVKSAQTNVFRFAPPLVINEEQVREAVRILGSVLRSNSAV